ncbi:MAG: hypothetical protein V3U71_03305 [Cocleimonas sp.]
MQIEYEMGYTPSEFKKTLQGQFTTRTEYSYKEFSPDHWLILLDKESMSVDIKINESTPRKIAMLTLPVLNVYFEFDNTSESQQVDFLKTFFKYFHKGGG